MKIRAIHFLALIISLNLFWGCGSTDPVFPIEPYIEFVSIDPETSTEGIVDGMTITIRFEDGDGDLGALLSGDQAPNLFVVDARANVPDTIGTFSYTVPDLSPDTRRPSIQGTIQITMDTPYLTKNFIPPYIGPNEENVNFRIRLIDRAGHSSNTIETDSIRISQ